MHFIYYIIHIDRAEIAGDSKALEAWSSQYVEHFTSLLVGEQSRSKEKRGGILFARIQDSSCVAARHNDQRDACGIGTAVHGGCKLR